MAIPVSRTLHLQIPPRTQNELLWLRSLAIGLAIFLIYSFLALQVTLIMPVGSFELAAVNFPGPKLNATTPIQRSIGGQPGEWGVAGTMATLMQVAGIWLITMRRSVRGDWEPAVSLRSAARWVSILGAGGLVGLALSGSGEFIPPMSDQCGGILICAILLAELPANALVYLYLRRIARQLESKRAEQILNWCIWIVPALTISAALLIFGDVHRDSAPPLAWHLMTGVYGAIAVGTSAAATAAVLLLLATSTAAGFGGWFADLRMSLRRWRKVPPSISAITGWLERNASRWCVVLGLLLWLWILPSVAEDALWRPGRVGMLGNIPMFGFVGPKVASRLTVESLDYMPQPQGLSIVLSLAAMWMITARALTNEPGSLRIMRWLARWAAVYAIGAPIGIQMALWTDERDRSYLLAIAVLACEIPATALLYFYLAQLARVVKGPVWTMRCMIFLAPAASALPLVGFVLHHYFKIKPHDVTLTIAASIAIAGSLGVTLLGASAALRLAWAVARQNLAAAIKPGANPIQTVHRSIALDARPADHCA
jgi:hypothetical protein